ncbi:MAG: alpha-glucosidase/alpha-galactosidase [Chloroflexota bacterium]
MGKAIKLGVVGAGSAQFSLGLVRDLCLAESLSGSTVTFMDVDEERLRTIHRLAERYVEELGIDLRFEATLEREGALRDADFVLNTALVGGHEPEEAGRRLAAEHGYYRGVRLQTNFHQYAMMRSVAQDMERVCPNAWLIQSSNPVFEGCTLMTRETGVKVVGLCHGFYGYRRLAETIGVPADEVEWEAPGVNHWIYLTQFRHKARDLYPLIDEWIETKAAEYWAAFRGRYGDTQLSRAAIDHYRRVGLMPIGDASRTFSEWYYHTDLETKRQWYGHLGGFDSEIGWGQYLEGLERNLQRIHDVASDESLRVTNVIKPERTREIQMPIIDAIANDHPGVFQVNVPNRGAIEGIADGVVVEGKALVDASGVKLLHVGRLPDKLMHLVLGPRIAKAERELAAFLTGDRDLLVSCLLIDDHRTRSLEQAEDFVDAMLSLPWNQDLAKRFGPRRRPLPAYRLEPAPAPASTSIDIPVGAIKPQVNELLKG